MAEWWNRLGLMQRSRPNYCSFGGFFLITEGIVLGVKGITGRISEFKTNDMAWRILFIVGVVFGEAICQEGL